MKSATLHRRACADVYGNLTKEKTIATLALLLARLAEPCRATRPLAHVGPACRALPASSSSTASKS